MGASMAGSDMRTCITDRVILGFARARPGQVMGAAVTGSDVRAYLMTGGGLRLKGLALCC